MLSGLRHPARTIDASRAPMSTGRYEEPFMPSGHDCPESMNAMGRDVIAIRARTLDVTSRRRSFMRSG
jgi:hypothetical protein